jgi:hypothetical protein
MSEQKHTPGPWHVLPLQSNIAADIQEPGSFSIGNSADVNQAVILCSRFPWLERADEMNANAHLIAAAPELLEALVRVNSLFTVGIDPRLDDALSSARAAIAKAQDA